MEFLGRERAFQAMNILYAPAAKNLWIVKFVG